MWKSKSEVSGNQEEKKPLMTRVKEGMRVTVLEVALTGVFLGILIAVKFLDQAMPKINTVSFWEIYWTVAVLSVIVLPWKSAILLVIIAPLGFFVVGQTWQTGPGSFIMDYSIPMASALVAKVSKNVWITIGFVIVAAIIKFSANVASGMIFFEVDFEGSVVFNYPFNAITAGITLALVIPLHSSLIKIKENYVQKRRNEW